MIAEAAVQGLSGARRAGPVQACEAVARGAAAKSLWPGDQRDGEDRQDDDQRASVVADGRDLERHARAGYGNRVSRAP